MFWKHFPTQNMRRNLKTCLLIVIIIFLIWYIYPRTPTQPRMPIILRWEDVDVNVDPQVKDQICNIPRLNPFHHDAMNVPSIRKVGACTTTKHAEIRNGNLYIKLKNVAKADIYYIRRVDDFKIELSENISLLGESKTQDVDIVYPLKEEFVKLELTIQGEDFVEYYAHILVPLGYNEKLTERRNKHDLNIVMIMFDSISNANVQRNLKQSYQLLKEDPNSFIFTGQSIVGDGTTAQLCAMLTGIPEEQLPEARRQKPDTAPVDRWPWIFKELHALDYKTLYSEDDSGNSAFTYRLHGFKEVPTTKYLRPIWMAMGDTLNEDSPACPHKFSFDYLKRYFDVFKNSKKFGMIVSSYLSHNAMDSIRVADNDIVDFYEFLSRSHHANNTVVFLFGDHGLRAGDFRSTLQGKLEERLPFMSITLPTWFNSYHEQMKNIKENTNIMTSHFDIYSTLQHLLTFPLLNNEANIKYGKSLFSNIRKLNRTCEQAGVDKHWCPCLELESISVSDAIVTDAVKMTIKHMNDMHEKEVNGSCSTLELFKIKHAGRKLPNRNVQKFVKTKKNLLCDSCEAKLDENIQLIDYTYEVSFSVLPSGGEYEVSTDCTFLGPSEYAFSRFVISRTNLYGNQPDCIARDYPHLRKYCFCKKRLHIDVAKKP